MEDDDGNKLKKIANSMDFGVDLESGIFSDTYKTINKNLFDNDYFNQLKKIENIIEKEFMIFIRKNQHFFKKIVLNNITVFDWNDTNNSFKSELNYFFNNLRINIDNIFKFDSLSEDETGTNSLQITMFILPKFKKNEINFNLNNDLIEISIKLPNIEKLYFDISKIFNDGKEKYENDERTKIENLEILNKLFEIELENLRRPEKLQESEEENINKNLFPVELYKIIIKDIKKIFLNHIVNYENISVVLSRFISHIQNYFPVICNKSNKERIDKAKNYNNTSVVDWQQSEQEKFEEALKIYKDEKDIKVKFKKISEFVQTKTAKECIERYKYISNLYKKEQEKIQKTEKSNNNKSLNDNKAKIKPNLINNVKCSNEKSKIIETDNSIIILIKDDKKNDNKSLEKLNKIDTIINLKEKNTDENKKDLSENNEYTNKQKEDSKIQANQQINGLNNLDTLDLVDQLLNQFDMNYLNINSTSNEASNNINQAKENSNNINNNDNLILILPANEQYPEGSEDELEEQEEEDNSEEVKTYSGSVAKFDKFLNYTYNDNVNNLHMQTILNMIKFGEKFAIQYSSVKLNRIALAEICDVNFFIKCKKCKMVTFESKFIRTSNKINLFYCATLCPKCKCHIQIIFKSELIHLENLQIAGISYSFGAIICDFLTSTFSINCLNCFDYYKKVKFRSGELAHKDRVCNQCQGEMNISTQNLQIVPYSSNNYSFLEDLEINNFKTNTQIIESQDLNEYVKLYEKKIKAGSPLPENGTCKHYHHSYKWFRFDCCCKYFPCDECHNEISNHEVEWAKLVLCGFCCFEQNSANKVCCKCGKGFSRYTGEQGFWEGGKGCRNKALMSNKDGHKYKNSDNKTISRRKMKETKENK
jgi:uncharacterized CHY-type Zn-finger protein